MKNLFAKFVAVLAVITAGNIIHSYQDKSFEQEYLYSVRESGHSVVMQQTDEKLLLMPDFVCGILKDGQTADDAIYAVVFDQEKRNNKTFIYGAIVVKYSVEYFCPEYKYQVDSWVK